MENTLSTSQQARIAILQEIKKHAHAMKRMAMYEAIEYRIAEDIRKIEKGKS
jgi:predicted transposase YdaD